MLPLNHPHPDITSSQSCCLWIILIPILLVHSHAASGNKHNTGRHSHFRECHLYDLGGTITDSSTCMCVQKVQQTGLPLMNIWKRSVGLPTTTSRRALGNLKEIAFATGPCGIVVNTSECRSEGHGFESHQSHGIFFSQNKLLPRMS